MEIFKKIINLFRPKKKLMEYECDSCGEIHEGLPALTFSSPNYYEELDDNEKKEIAEISDDFCVIRHSTQTDRFIRTVLTLSINNETCETLDYGIWVSLSEGSFDDYKSNFENGEEKTYFGRICNKIPDYKESTLGLHVNVNTQKGDSRPEIIPHQGEHQLIADYENGISMREVKKRVDNMMRIVGS